jgi:glutamyl-tRNA(Gln) amidotransferase subunit E
MKVKCGFEWHVQLDGGKLFCRCKPVMHDENTCDFEVKRLLRPSFGESGRIDQSAKFEAETNKNITYKVFLDSDCLVDLDEEPPHEPDHKALETAFEMANALDTTLFKNLIFMRKTIVDGSNTSGFQRTATIGEGGKFRVAKHDIGISSISIEEDSARKDEEDAKHVVYKLDRLGIPLVEISTEVIETNETEAKEIALAFGRFTRLFDVRRGIGTIRQDVNLSIEGGSRVELKGFQNIREVDKAILNEAKRQAALIAIKKEKAYLLEDLDSARIMDISEVLKNSQSSIIMNAPSKGKGVFGIRLVGFKGVLGTELIENKRFGTEVGDYLRVKENGGIIHSDELPAYGITEEEKKAVWKKLECTGDDAFLFSICESSKQLDVKEAIKTRIKELLTSVPSEVRAVNADNTTSFLRPLGGKDRMYVETDLPIVPVDKKTLEKAEEFKGFNADSLKEKYDLGEEHLNLLIGVNKLNTAIKIKKKTRLPFSTIISVLVDDYRYIKRRFGLDLSDHEMESVLSDIAEDTIAKDASRFIFESIALGKGKTIQEIIKKYDLKKKGRKTLESAIKKLLSSAKFDSDTLITNLRDKFGFSFEAREAYEIASKLLKNGQNKSVGKA